MEFVLKGVELLYAFLHYADQDKVPNLSEVIMRFSMVENEYESLLQGYPTDLRKYLDIIWPQARDVKSHTYVNAGKTDFSSWFTVCAYDIVFNIHLLMCNYCFASKDTLHLWHFSGVMTDLRQAFEFMTDTNTCVVALQEAEHYRRKQRSFSSELAAKMACDNNTSPGKL
jgi:hypothetical protein